MGRLRRGALPACVAACSIGLAACSGDSGGPVAAPGAPTARETPQQAIAALRSIAMQHDCPGLAERWSSANEPLTPAKCLELVRQLGDLRDVRVTPHATAFAASFATPTPGSGRSSALMVVDTDHRWRLVLVVRIDRGPSPSPGGVDARLRASISAIAGLDCPAVLRLLHRSIGMASAPTDDQACRDVASSEFAQDLAVHDDAPLHRLGGGRNFTFYGLDFGQDGYYTIVMVRDPLGLAPGRPVVQRFVTALHSR